MITWVDIVSVSAQGSNGRLPNILWVTRTPRIKVEYVKIEDDDPICATQDCFGNTTTLLLGLVCV